MNKLNWKNGDLFEEVRNLKRSLDDLQRDIDNDPHNAQLRSSGVQLLQEYSVAIDDEEKLLIGILLSSTKSLGVE
nr:RNA-directed DNA polymerase, eukaryota, reverse transcriptase zinc-binding domain protein [Tanacetum cinerariifolium]